MVIDKSANRKNFVVNNNLSKAVNIEAEMARKEAIGFEEDLNKVEKNIDESKEIVNKINEKLKSLSPVKKSEAKKKVEAAGLPSNFKGINDVEILNKILDTVNSL